MPKVIIDKAKIIVDSLPMTVFLIYDGFWPLLIISHRLGSSIKEVRVCCMY
jgi:hypothetical protein